MSGAGGGRPFEYALLRVVPDTERGEAINGGVVLRSRPDFVAARVSLDEGRLLALAPGIDTAAVRAELERMAAIAAEATPERFEELVAAATGAVRAGPLRFGRADDPRSALDELFARLVLPPLAAMRREYLAASLEEDALAPTWLDQFRRWFGEAAGVVGEPNALVLATADAAGAPSARVVLLKGVDERGFTFFTSLASRKGRDVAANPRACLVFPWVAMERQVVVTGSASPVPAEESDAYFASRPRGAQLSALASPQSAVVASRGELERRRARTVAEHPEGTPVPRPPGWGGLRLAPETVEFWQGRPDRLHDRLRFRRAAGGEWTVERLAP